MDDRFDWWIQTCIIEYSNLRDCEEAEERGLMMQAMASAPRL